MRPVTVSLSAAGPSAWIPIDYVQIAFGIGLGCAVSSGASLTYSVQHTFDDPNANRKVTISRTTTTATVTDTAHGLSTNDSVTIFNSGSSNLDGTYTITFVDANTYTYTVANSGATADSGNAQVISFRVYQHATIVGQTGRVDGNYAFPVRAVRINNTTYVSGTAYLTVIQGIGD